MTFLNPFVLFGLAAAAIPIVIHLLNKRKLRTIDFSTLSFLKELQKNTMRKVTIRQWLLLLVRTLMILFLVLAFSRPALKGSFGAVGSHAKTSVAIIIDNTPSMGLHNERGVFLDQALKQASEIVAMMQENDDAIILRLSDLPGVTMDAPSHDRGRLLSLIEETVPSLKHRTVSDALRAVSAIVQQSKNANKEIYILTDGQQTTWSSSTRTSAVNEQLFDPSTRFYISRYSGTPAENIGIQRVTIPPTVLQVNKPVPVNAVIKNYGSSPVVNHRVTVSAGTKQVMQKSVSLDGGESRTVEFSVTPVRPGFFTGSIDLEDDHFEPDNRHYFSFPVPDRVSVALVASDERHAQYITAALRAANSLTESGSVDVKTFSPQQISTSMLSAADVVIISGISDFPESAYRLLHQHISGGGAMIFFPAGDTTQTSYRYLDQFSLSIAGMASVPVNNPLLFNRADLEFPIFSGMFDNIPKDVRSIESPNVTSVLRIPSQTTVRPIITLSNDLPFLWLREYRNGKILGFSVPASSSWSDFVFTGLFVPVLYQSILYVTSDYYRASVTKDFVAGDQLEFTAFRNSGALRTAPAAVQSVDPEQRPSPLQYYAKSMPEATTHMTYMGSEMTGIGHYVIVSDRDTLAALSVNIDKAESEGSLAVESDMIGLLASMGADERSLSFPEADASLPETVMQSRFGLELWRFFAMAAVLLGLLEMIIARERSAS